MPIRPYQAKSARSFEEMCLWLSWQIFLSFSCPHACRNHKLVLKDTHDMQPSRSAQQLPKKTHDVTPECLGPDDTKYCKKSLAPVSVSCGRYPACQTAARTLRLTSVLRPHGGKRQGLPCARGCQRTALEQRPQRPRKTAGTQFGSKKHMEPDTGALHG